MNKLKEILKQVLRENEQKGKPKCFNCGKGDNFQRNCKVPRNRSRPVSPTRRCAIATPKSSSINYVETRMRGKPENSEDHPKLKLPKVKPKKSPNTYTAAEKVEVMKAEKKESIAAVRRMQIKANEDLSGAQRSDPILAKIIVAKEEDKRPTRNEISAEGPLKKALRDSLRLINELLYRNWESADGNYSSNSGTVLQNEGSVKGVPYWH